MTEELKIHRGKIHDRVYHSDILEFFAGMTDIRELRDFALHMCKEEYCDDCPFMPDGYDECQLNMQGGK